MAQNPGDAGASKPGDAEAKAEAKTDALPVEENAPIEDVGDVSDPDEDDLDDLDGASLQNERV